MGYKGIENLFCFILQKKDPPGSVLADYQEQEQAALPAIQPYWLNWHTLWD